MSKNGWSSGRDNNGVFDSGQNDVPSSAGLVTQERSPASAPEKQTQRPTAIRGTNNTSVVALDVSIHDQLGNAYTTSNPLPVLNIDPTDVVIGTKIYDISASQVNQIGFQEIFTHTVINPETTLQTLECTAGTTCTFQVKIQGNVVRMLRSSPMQRNVEFNFFGRPVQVGDVITVEVSPERLFQASHDTFVSFEAVYIS